jgi:hypothetical protein
MTYYKENHLYIDNYSLNRVVNINEDEERKIMMTNSFMLQNNDSLTCRYTTGLKIPIKSDNKGFGKSNLNNNIHLILNILFYPFIKLKTNKKASMYESIVLKKKYNMKFTYLITSE